jgi:hypothetical protein
MNKKLNTNSITNELEKLVLLPSKTSPGRRAGDFATTSGANSDTGCTGDNCSRRCTENGSCVSCEGSCKKNLYYSPSLDITIEPARISVELRLIVTDLGRMIRDSSGRRRGVVWSRVVVVAEVALRC